MTCGYGEHEFVWLDFSLCHSIKYHWFKCENCGLVKLERADGED